MSSDADAGASSSAPTPDAFGRQEGVTTTTERLPEGARHGIAGSFVLADCYRDAGDVDLPEAERLPDGSLYQHARAARLAADEPHGPELLEDNDGRERVVLSRSFQLDDQRLAVVMTDSRWRAGTGQGENYRPWFKYDMTARPVDDDGSVRWDRTPATSLNVKIQPQREGLVDSDGKELNLPFGEGTLVSVQTTWADDPRALFERAARMVREGLGYGSDPADVVPDSRRLWKAEVHHRVDEEAETDLVHTIRQSADLLAHHEADLETKGIHDDHTWLECKLKTAAWEKLGFPRIGRPVQIKLYYPDAREFVEYPMNQPKVEVALLGSGRGDHYGWDDWDRIQGALQEILLSHLHWAAVDRDQLLADDYSDGAANPVRAWQHPQGRRTWLANHYENLLPSLYREAQKANTDLVFDILDTVRRHGTCTYQRLMDETGGSYRSVRRHVTRLAAMGGDEPGILKKIHDAETWVAFSSRALDEKADDSLEDIPISSSPDDREERAEERRERRRKRRERRQTRDAGAGDPDDRDQDDVGDQDDTPARTWRYFDDVDLTPDQLAAALERDHVDQDHVRVRTDPYHWIPTG